MSSGFSLQLIPVRGRKRLVPCFQVFPFQIAIYPRKGTKTTLLPGFWLSFHHCNLSLQGDENTSSRFGNTSQSKLQFIPMRGRKLSRFKPSFLVHLLQLIPAGGRKPVRPRKGVRLLRLQFIPARGRKLVRIHCHIQLVPIVTYPRKGTETAFHEYKH